MVTASSWLMTLAQTQGRGQYQRDIVGDTPYGIVTGTEKRDVSEALDLLALSETPFINAIGWGPESGGNTIEWISEDLGPGVLRNISNTVSYATTGSFVANSVDGMAASQSIKQIKQGSVIYKFDSVTALHTLAVITSTPFTGGTGTSITFSIITVGHANTLLSALGASIAANENWYVLGAFANEGSIPNQPTPRERVVCSNNFTILRQDVQITGTMQSTEMYAIGKEDRHQVLMRLKEMQRDRERAALYSAKLVKTSGLAGMIDGVLGFLGTQTGAHIDNSTTALTETAVNAVVTAVWESGGRNLTFFAHINQCAKFTRWDKNRIRSRVNEGLGGGRITSYLTESGIEIDLVPMAHVPTNLAYLLDTSKITLRAKKGRKAIMEKLGKMGDFDDWQLLSEFSMEMKGYNLRQHGMFAKLTG